MTTRKKVTAVGDETTFDNGMKPPVVTRKTTRSASAAFGDENDESVESPVRKKQNTSSSSAKAKLQDQSTAEYSSTIATLNNSNSNSSSSSSSNINNNNNIQPVINDCPRGSGVDCIDSAVSDTNPSPNISRDNEKEEEPLLDLVPPTHTMPTRPKAITADISTGTEKLVEKGTTTTIASASSNAAACRTSTDPQNADNDKSESNYTDATLTGNSSSISRSGRTHNSYGGLLWFGFFCFANLAVFAGMIWSGLLLNERAIYQLESLECRERLQQAYHATGLPGVVEDSDDNDGYRSANANDDDDNNNNSNRLEEQQFYLQELEAQVRYWKKEAKKYQRYGDGFKEQCREDLEHLLTEVVPQVENQQES